MIQSSLSVYKKEGKDMINFEKDSEKKYRELLDMYYKDREEYEKELETA